VESGVMDAVVIGAEKCRRKPVVTVTLVSVIVE
jgi:hypothetical protein